MSTISDLFNPKGAIEVEKKNSEVYRVNFKEGKGNVYKSVVRFIPWYADPTTNMMKKWVSYVKNPITESGMYVDDPKSGEQGSLAVSPVSDMYWKLNNTGIETYKDIADKCLKSRLQYASLVQILQDEQHPELVGQIKVFIYGKKIYDKIWAEEHPVSGEGINPFHPIYGRRFSVVCVAQSNFNNFDQSSFYDERVNGGIAPSGMWYIDPQTNQYAVVDENTSNEVLYNYLAANSPDLSKYAVQPWTEQQTNHVNEVLGIIQNYLNTGSFASQSQVTMQQGMNAVNNVVPQQTFANPMSMPVNNNPIFPGVTSQPQFAPQQPSSVSQPHIPQPAPAPQQFAPSPVVQQPIIPNPVPQAPAQPNSNISGVEPPVVSPQQTTPMNKPQVQNSGMNVEDILSQL